MAQQAVSLNEKFEDFILSFKDESGKKVYEAQINEIIAYRKRSFVIDFAHLSVFEQTLASELLNNPRLIVPQLEKVLYDLIVQRDPSFRDDVEKVNLRLVNIPRVVELRKIRHTDVGKLIAIEGILVKQTPIKQRIKKAVFKHTLFDKESGELIEHEIEWPPGDEEMGEVLDAPTECPEHGKGGQFKFLPEKSKIVDWQKAVLQERPEEIPAGQLPRQIEVILEDDLVDSARPGDRVKIVGILELKQESTPKKGSRAVFDLYLRANSVEVSQKILDEVKITEEDRRKILETAKDQWIKEKIITSIAPSIYGHWEIKEALALALFGGVPKTLPDGTRIRGDIHVLIVGDPGTAKSQLLQFVARIAPRAVYTTGKGSTAAGLTATVTRDKQTGDFYLEAGALVLADGGVAVIDEIDKMREEDRVAIHEAMEQQTVSIAKAGIVAKLNARATVIAAGNPKLGRYIRERSLSDNINLPPTILSRFDLIFIVLDTPGEEDQRLASHILSVHQSPKRLGALDPEFLKKYVAYARKYVQPKLTDEAKRILMDFFVQLRKRSAETPDSPILITPRQLEALIRISEAYARMALKETVDADEAQRAINIMRIFLESVGLDVESGKIDIDTIMVGRPKSATAKLSKILDIISELTSSGGCAKIKEIVKEAKGQGIDDVTTNKYIAELKRNGLIYEVQPECFKKA
jgi:replicative DNA helicase Mcm